jgi:hypothetical protein
MHQLYQYISRRLPDIANAVRHITRRTGAGATTIDQPPKKLQHTFSPYFGSP